jgi:endonuclease YncB( thermonuclease family)|uniref:TNase-like domain-containing protein n=1 Tax=viral metagenome TaxID=1070528 RepID=A0A6C0IQZ8_9ZZZZ
MYLLYFCFSIFITEILCKHRHFRPPKYLQAIKYEDCTRFIPKFHYAKVVKVYDGDTITVACKYPIRGSHLYRFPVRLAGIDAPELNSDDSNERVHADVSRTKLHELIFNETVYLDNIRIEKYGRLLADVYFHDIHVNAWLLDNKYAIPYYGGKKLKIDYN